MSFAKNAVDRGIFTSFSAKSDLLEWPERRVTASCGIYFIFMLEIRGSFNGTDPKEGTERNG